ATSLGAANLPADLVAGFVGDRPFIAYRAADVQPLSTRVSRSGPLHVNEARGILHGVLDALRKLHEAGLPHGAVKLENVLVGKKEGGPTLVFLVDNGGDLLWSAWVHSDTESASANRVKGLAPEQFKGFGATTKSDLYGFGALMFELLTGKPPIDGPSAADLAFAHVSSEPARAIDLAPKGWVTEALSDLCSKLLSKDPTQRPDFDAIVAVIGTEEDATAAISEDDLTAAIDTLIADPTNTQAALALELTIDQKAEPQKVAEAFLMAAEMVELGEAATAAGAGEENEHIREAKAEAARDRAREVKKALLFRAARLFESKLKDHGATEDTFKAILDLDPEDAVAQSGFESALKAQDKLDELVEKLLEVSQSSERHSDRARALHKIGQLYVGPLDDKEQAVFAFAQALGQDIENDDYADDLERAAGTDLNLWAEAMRELHEVSSHPRMPQETRIALFMRLGRWYIEKVGRPDLGLPCFETVLTLETAHEGALQGMTDVYRKAQQWNELVAVLVTRVDRALTPERARDLRSEAAEILETRINDLGRARDLYEATLAEDPGHQKTVDALARIYQRNGDSAGYVKILERQAEALTGAQRAETLARIAEIFEDNLSDLAEAQRRFEAALEFDPSCLNAIRGLDRVFNRTGRYQELLANLERQVTISATPRQRITLLERIAGIHEEEYLDHTRAAESLEKILSLDAGHEGAITGLMRHYRALDRWDDVNSLYERALKVTSEPARRIQLLLGQGRVLLNQIGSPERARVAYETVLELDPKNASALDLLAHVRAATGDAMAALAAVESLAEKAETPEAKAEQWLRAGRILEQHGDRDGAIQRFKLALESQPNHAGASDALRKAYLARGDAAHAAELIEAEIERTEGKLAKARLLHELAVLKREKLNDIDGARETANRAATADPGNAGALLLLGDIAFERAQFIEASNHYGALTNRLDALAKADAKRLLIRYVDSLGRTGSTEKAKTTVQALLDLAPDDHEALARVARVQLDSGDAAGAVATYDTLFEKFDKTLDGEERGEALLTRGKALRMSGKASDAIKYLEEASELLLGAPSTLDELAKAHEAAESWEDVVRIKQRQLDTAEGEGRTNLLVDIGEVLATQLKDSTRAARSFVAALEERPDDRRVLTRLMRLYSEEKDWTKLLEVVTKLAESIDEPKQKSKYLHTASGIAIRQASDVERGIELLTKVLELDPGNDKARKELLDAYEAKGDWSEVVPRLESLLERAAKAGDTARQIELLDKLAAIFKDHLDKLDDAVALLEKARELDTENAARASALSEIYASDLDRFVDKALQAQHDSVRRDPFNPQGYRALRKLYTHKKSPDPAWCACQVLHVMKSAEPDEERFFSRMRSETSAEAQERVSADEWSSALTHELVDPVLTQIFQLIEPAIFAKNARPIDQLGLHPAYAVDLAMFPFPIPQTLYYSAGVLGITPPPTFQNPQDPSGIGFLHASPPSILLGQAALQTVTGLSTQAHAFLTARHLTYYRPGLYVRHLVPTGTGLRAWLFGAIRLIHEAFPVAAELESTVRENSQVIRPVVEGPAREQLASLVTKLLQGGSIDLKRWVAGIDLTADRAGFLVAHDLETACEMVKASEEASAAVPHRDRIRELTLFSVDPKYFALRSRLAISIDS
ncbi:MAG: tetratricopeptide repeat protein, partial [Deltaproteobacteria bacterium]|nr:tetratricopeptide repeat protein [Deltaproteobacteria bacterium]